MLNANFLFGQQLDYKLIESTVQQVVKRVVPATVAVEEFDTIRNKVSGIGRFSAVVVTPEGHILSVAHGASPNKVYQVTFSDGKKVLALGLGSIKDADAAMLKIIPAGKWPYAEMGWSSGLAPFQPLISLGYPGSMKHSGPALVRFGYITASTFHPGFFCHTALMEPGDSGGPSFDINGRVIGIHSRISQVLDGNFEVPIDTFRRYWDQLLIPKAYR